MQSSLNASQQAPGSHLLSHPPPPPQLELEINTSILSFLGGQWDLNADPYVCEAGTLPLSNHVMIWDLI